MSKAWIEIIEASYRIDQTELDWLRTVLGAAKPELHHGLGTWAMTYDLAGADGVALRVPVTLDMPDGVLEGILQAQAAVPPSVIRETFRTTTCGTASQVIGKTFDRDTSIDQFRDQGVGDTLGINVRDPTTSGVLFVGILPKVSALSEDEATIWKKVAAHIASGFRLQRKLAAKSGNPTSEAAAILTPDGKVEHAIGDAREAEALDDLRRAVAEIEAARGSLRRSAPEEAVEQWKGLVASRWTLLEHFDLDGRRYMVACENAPIETGPAMLTDRERQILSYAALGHTNKLIAYELGLAASASTVRVLLARASAKLGTNGREDTVRAYVAMTSAHDLATS